MICGGTGLVEEMEVWMARKLAAKLLTEALNILDVGYQNGPTRLAIIPVSHPNPFNVTPYRRLARSQLLFSLVFKYSTPTASACSLFETRSLARKLVSICCEASYDASAMPFFDMSSSDRAKLWGQTAPLHERTWVHAPFSTAELTFSFHWLHPDIRSRHFKKRSPGVGGAVGGWPAVSAYRSLTQTAIRPFSYLICYGDLGTCQILSRYLHVRLALQALAQNLHAAFTSWPLVINTTIAREAWFL